ncbi:MAG: hypothetical protein RR705_02690 [Lachnospiraceae bacterium]
MAERHYNFIYEKLVISDDDLVGLVAYGIYKKHKIEFITRFKEEHQRDPEKGECEAFFITSTTESQLAKYRDQAESILSEAVGNVASEEISKFEKEMLRNYKAEIKQALPSGWMTIGLGILSAFIFSLIAALFFFLGGTSEKSTFDNTTKAIKALTPERTEENCDKSDTIQWNN